MAGLSTQNRFGLQEATGSSSRAAAVPSTHNLLDLFVFTYCLLLFITAAPNTQLCAWGEEDSGEHVTAMKYDKPRLVWTSLTTTH